MVHATFFKGLLQVFQPIRWESFFLGVSNLVYVPDVGSGESWGQGSFGEGDGSWKFNFLKGDTQVM